MTQKLIAILAGDGIGPEVITQAQRVLAALGLDPVFEEALSPMMSRK